MEINSGRLPFDLHFRPASPLAADGGSHLYRYAAESQPQRFGISGKVLVAIHFMPMKIMSQTLLLSLLIPCNFWEQAFSNDRKFLGSISHDQMFKVRSSHSI